MYRRLVIVAVSSLLLAGCGNKNSAPLKGTVTLDNELFSNGSYYYAMGLSFAEGGEVPTLPDPDRADITVQAGPLTTGGAIEAYLSANTLDPAFSLTGTYTSAEEATTAFNNLKEAVALSYIDLASPLLANQVWVVRTRESKYAKIVIRNVTLDTSTTPPSASCTLEWVYQPDGTTRFP